MNRRHKGTWWCGAGAVLLIAAISCLLRFAQPVRYEGKTVRQLVSDTDRDFDATYRLTSIGPSAVDPLIRILEDRESIFETAYLHVWQKLPKTLQAQFPNPLFNGPIDKRIIYHILTSIGEPLDLIIPVVRIAATNSESEIRFAAVSSLRNLSPTNASILVPALTNALVDSRSNVRGVAASVLGTIGEEAGEAATALAMAMSDEDAEVRMHVARALRNVGVTSLTVTNALYRGLQDYNQKVQVNSARALHALTGNVQPSLQVIENVLWKGESYAREAAFYAVVGFGTNALPLVPMMEKIERSSTLPAVVAAAEARWSATGVAESSLDHLSMVLRSTDWFAKFQAVEVLRRMGQSAAPALPTMIEFLEKETDPRDFLRMMEVVGGLGAAGKPALESVRPFLTHRSLRVRDAAASTIASINEAEPARNR